MEESGIKESEEDREAIGRRTDQLNWAFGGHSETEPLIKDLAPSHIGNRYLFSLCGSPNN